VRDIAYAAGDAIMVVYRTDFDSERKDDGSPVTLADTAAEAITTFRFSGCSTPRP
jgi:3'(2'), 5'-bisphosphate nucleotidase